MTFLPKPPIDNLDIFLSKCHRRRYPSKSTIIYAGDKADVLYYIVKGKVSVLVEEQKDNKEMVITYLHAGDFSAKWAFLKTEFAMHRLKQKLIVRSVRSVTPNLDN